MRSVIEEFYHGGIDPGTCAAATDTYKKMSGEVTDLTQRFLSKLPVEYHDEFDFIMNKQLDVSAYLEQQQFSIGFCLGARLLLEVVHYETP